MFDQQRRHQARHFQAHHPEYGSLRVRRKQCNGTSRCVAFQRIPAGGKSGTSARARRISRISGSPWRRISFAAACWLSFRSITASKSSSTVRDVERVRGTFGGRIGFGTHLFDFEPRSLQSPHERLIPKGGPKNGAAVGFQRSFN